MRRFFRTTTVALTFMLCLTMQVMLGTAFSAGAKQCEDNGDGTVTDSGSGLMWQQATGGHMDWYAAMSYCNNLSLGGHSGWRLPTKDELEGLAKSPCKYEMDIRTDWYWSSTSIYNLPEGAWRVIFYDGNARPRP